MSGNPISCGASPVMAGTTQERLPKGAETKKQGGCRKRGRPPMRWEDCVKKDVRKAEEEEKCIEKANNRER